jgi:hypothetical protein
VMTVNAAAPAGVCLRTGIGQVGREHDQLHDAPARAAALPEPEGAGGPGTSAAVLGDGRAVAGVVLPDQRLAVHARGTSDGADVPARKEVAAASGEVVLFDPPDGRLPNAAARLRRGCGYRLILPRFPHRERSPGVGIRLPAGENRGGLVGLPVAECQRPRGHGHYGTL